MEISWTSKSIVKKHSKIAGEGVFAIKNIAKGELVAIFGGFCIEMQALNNLKKTNPKEYETILEIGYQIDDGVVFSPISSKQFSAIEYLNHSCNANCGFDGEIKLVAIKNIRTGEEISMDYATCITSKLFEMKCTCSSSECRDKVLSNDWTLPTVQRKYGRHFQPYILKKIRALKSNSH